MASRLTWSTRSSWFSSVFSTCGVPEWSSKSDMTDHDDRRRLRHDTDSATGTQLAADWLPGSRVEKPAGLNSALGRLETRAYHSWRFVQLSGMVTPMTRAKSKVDCATMSAIE